MGNSNIEVLEIVVAMLKARPPRYFLGGLVESRET